jgi:hypothetical protein
MRLMVLIILTILLTQIGLPSVDGQEFKDTYPITRDLLSRMERDPPNKALEKLFEEGEERMPDLIQALSDPDLKVNLNSQVIIRYLNEPRGNLAIEEWFVLTRKQGKDYKMPGFIPPKNYEEGRLLTGNNRDLAKLVLSNWTFRSEAEKKLFTARLIAYSKSKEKALILVTNNCVPLCGTGWHVVLRKADDGWHYLFATVIWQS